MVSQVASGVVIGDVGSEWIIPPGKESFGTAHELHEWAASTARERTAERPQAAEWLAMSLAAIAASTPDSELRALYLPSLTADLAIVRVLAVERDSAPVDLAEVVGATDPAAVEPPVLEGFETAAFGPGVRSVRFLVAADDRTLTGVVTYAFDVAGIVVRVSYADTDLTRLTELADPVDRFVSALRLQYGGPAAVVPK
ncbi:hypothetical protein ACQXVK_06045 [Curtobacterium sp. AB451]|uniref:hypothetical protein n=1 Tax=Curtobacterium sp. AB451 TaxID=3422306 RepID=UPI003D349421